MKRTLVSTTCAIAAALACLPAAAQSSVAAAGWQFEFSPYAWAPGVKGNLNVADGLISRSTSISSTNIIKALDYAVMGTFEARNGAWGALLDINLVQLGQSRNGTAGFLGGYDVKFKEKIYTLAGTYRLVEDLRWTLDLVAGARYVGAKATIYVAPGIYGIGRYIEDNGGWWNGIVGAQVKVPVSEKWSLMGYVDTGSGAGATSLQGIAGAIYEYSPTTSIKMGYRYLSFKRDGKPLDTASLGGLYLGAGFKF